MDYEILEKIIFYICPIFIEFIPDKINKHFVFDQLFLCVRTNLKYEFILSMWRLYVIGLFSRCRSYFTGIAL